MIKSRTIRIDKLICEDDSHRPNEISINNWVKKGEEYTPIKLCYNPVQKLQYFVLKEISTGNPQYGGYRTTRFRVPQSIIDQLIEEGEFELVEK